MGDALEAKAETRTRAKVVSLGQVEGLQPVLADVQVQSTAQEHRLHVAAVAVSSLCSKETRLYGCKVTAAPSWRKQTHM